VALQDSRPKILASKRQRGCLSSRCAVLARLARWGDCADWEEILPPWRAAAKYIAAGGGLSVSRSTITLGDHGVGSRLVSLVVDRRSAGANWPYLGVPIRTPALGLMNVASPPAMICSPVRAIPPDSPLALQPGETRVRCLRWKRALCNEL